MLQKEHCKKCDYTWQKRIEGEPKQCPRCKSISWNQPKKEEVKKDGKEIQRHEQV